MPIKKASPELMPVIVREAVRLARLRPELTEKEALLAILDHRRPGSSEDLALLPEEPAGFTRTYHEVVKGAIEQQIIDRKG